MSLHSAVLLYCLCSCYIIKNVVSQTNQPNFIFILADDQALLFNETDPEYMPNLNKFIVDKGVTFTNAFISTPVCCPSRTETITGRNYQNIGPPNGTCFLIDAVGNVFNNAASMFQLFQASGYETAAFGKVTNDQASYWCNSTPKLKGFDRIHCPCQFDNFYGTKYFDLFPNGTSKLYNIKQDANAYETAVVGNATMQYLKEHMANSKNKPFIAWIGPHSPHLPATPAEWNSDKFNDLKAPRTPNFNVHVSNHHGFVTSNPELNETNVEWIDQIFRNRLRSQIAVDDLIGDIFAFLEANDLVDSTYVVYSSDHGFHLGQWRIPDNKYQMYDTDIRIPMHITGPNVNTKKTMDEIVGNIDLLPTFLDIANVKYNENTYDGKSWKSFLFDSLEDDWNRTVFLTQYRYIMDVYNQPTHDFNIESVWFPDTNGSSYPGRNLHAPCCDVLGQPIVTDAIDYDNWRALRIINGTHDIVYAEFVDFAWTQDAFENPIFYEYYDLNLDPYQFNNTYEKLSQQQQTEFHQMLMDYGSCHGTDCW